MHGTGEGPALLNFRFGESSITLWPPTDEGKYRVQLCSLSKSTDTRYFSFPSGTCALAAIAGIFAPMK